MPPPVPFDRAAMLRRLADETFDVLVVGGGITGAGVALDAASRGLRTALVERDDFASGTSSKSSKLIHGGLRYLQQGEVALVYEALAERQRLRRNAPHLVRVLPFLIPILTRDGVMNAKIARALGTAMWGYDLTGGLRIGKRHERLTADEALDPPADDAGRPAGVGLPLLRRPRRRRPAVPDRGPHRRRPRRRRGQPRRRHRPDQDGRRRGHGRHRARPTARTIDVRARVVVNAAGVWADDVRALDEGTHPQSIRPAKGVHITVPWSKVRNDIAVVIPVPKDRRSLFVVPWGELHLRRHDRHRLRRPARRPAVHARGHRLRPAGAQPLGHDRRHRGRHRRHVGRAASARAPGRRAAPPTCPAATGSRPRPGGSSPSPAASSRPTGAWRPTPSTTS